MRTCHACQSELDAAAVEGGRCSCCGAPIPNITKRTIQDNVAERNKANKSPAEEVGSQLPQDETESAEDTSVELSMDRGLQSGDGSQSPSLSGEDRQDNELGTKLPTIPDAWEQTVEATVYLDPSKAVIPSAAGKEGKADPTRRSTHTFEADVTVDLDDSGESVDLNLITSQWGGACNINTPSGQTIRQSGTVAGFRSSLPVKSRSVRQRKTGKQTDRVEFSPADVPDYELLDVIGQGGMGVVYAALQSSIARTVAVKMLKPTKKIGEEQRDKFISEAVVTGELDHPNIVPIYDLGANDEGALFYSMKHVKGTPWDKVLPEKRVDENLDVLLRVADAVAFAHAHGVVHRDLKPENVMLGDYGEVLVMDWGLARVTPNFANADTIYQVDSLGGTPAYMAPEMARGPVDEIDFASDIYLLGGILYEIVGGKPPHSGRDVMQCLMAAAQNRIEPIEYEGELKAIALRAMATRKQDRYATVKDFQDAIRVYQSHSESLVLTARAEQNLEQARRSNEYEPYARAVYGCQEALSLWSGNESARALLARSQHEYAQSAFAKGDFDLAATLLDPIHDSHAELLSKINHAQRERDARNQRLRNARRLVTALVVSIAGILAVATVWISMKHRQAVQAQLREEEERQKAEEARDVALRAQEDEAKARQEEARQRELAEQKRIEAELARNAAQTAQRQETLAKEQALEAQAKEELERRRAEAAKQAEEEEAYVARIGLAAARIDENAYDFAKEVLQDCPTSLRNWEWGRLAYLCDLSTFVYEDDGPVDVVRFSPNGEQCISGDWTGKAVVRDVATGNVVHTFRHGQNVHAVDFSPSGQLVATGSSDPQVHIIEVETGRILYQLDGHTDEVLSVRFSPDGKLLLSTSYDNTARLWDVESGRPLQVLRGHSWWVWAGDFSPDGRRIVTAGQDGKAIVWQRDDSAGGAHLYRNLTEFGGHDGAVYAARFSPDGRLVATGGYDETVMVWNPDEVKPIDIRRRVAGLPDPRPTQLILDGHEGPVRSVDFSPVNDQMLVSGSHDNTLRMWDVSTGTLYKVLRGHSGRVRSCQFSPTGGFIISGAYDERVMLWNIDGYEEVRVMRGRVLDGHQDAVLSARFSPDGKQIVTASRDRTASLWDVQTGNRIREFAEGHEFLASTIAFFPDGRRLATGAGDNSVRIWDIATGTQLHEFSRTGRMGTLAISPDGRFIVTGSQPDPAQRLNNAAIVWDIRSGEKIATLSAHPAEVTAASVAPDGVQIVTGDDAGNLRLWRRDAAGQFAPLRDLDGHTASITAIHFVAAGQRLVTASGDNTCAQWDLASGRELRNLALRHDQWVSSLDVTKDGKFAVTTCEDGNVRLWSLADARLVRVLAAKEMEFNSASIAPSGKAVLLTSADRREIRLWRVDFATGAAQIEKATELLVDFNNVGGSAVWSARFTPDGNAFVSIGGDDARLWDLLTGEQVVRFSPHGAVAAATLSPDGLFLVTGSWDNSAKIWDVATGRALRRLDGGHTDQINSVDFSPDGAEVLTGGDDGLARVWDFSTGRLLPTIFHGHSARILQAVYSPDGMRILTVSGDKTARIWNRQTGNELLVFGEHDGAVLCGQFSSDGRRVVTGCEDNKARVWDAGSGELLQTLSGHTAGVTSVMFSPDATRVITGSRDSTAKVWDPDKEKEILSLNRHERELSTVAFSPDGQLVLTGSRDGTAIVWLAVNWREARQFASLWHRE